MNRNLFLFVTCMFISVHALGSSSGNTIKPTSTEDVTRESTQPNYQLLFIGNSHSAANRLPELVAALIMTGLPGSKAHPELAPGYVFLEERLDDGVTQQALDSRSWTHVILQAQKYSSSGRYFYATDAAEEWIRRVKARGARPLLFPEWPRKGNTEEGPRIHDLHLGISARESACVAPVGLAWDEYIARFPQAVLHARDGNHSNLSGALLTAYVFYQLISGQSADELPYIGDIDVSAEMQSSLSTVAAFVVTNNRVSCPE